MKVFIGVLTSMLLLAACGGGSTAPTKVPTAGGPIDATPVKTTDNLALPNNQGLASYNVLILGNSHVQYIEPLLKSIFTKTNKTVNIETRTGAFLDAIVKNESIIELLESKQWSHVILQGQKYSQSQSVLYSTEATIVWIQRVKAIGATPILFPEHPPEGKTQEAEYVHGIHQDIASMQLSCVAPVGLAWNKALSIEPNIVVYQADGNHASELGASLSAFVLYETITGEPADLLPFISGIVGDLNTQSMFKQVSSEVISSNPPCLFKGSKVEGLYSGS
ncbi:hypothetical protein GCM10009111_23190 [Colwellia asteriadis]|uniref:Uncharacterized protein n=2 Tax=Colwellia asteriadis TaxID=517723 RepID=A0ABP3WHH1_9GAMM